MRFAPGFRFLPFFAALALGSLSACLTNPAGPPVQEPTTITLSTYRIVFTSVNDHVRIDATVLDQDSRVITDATVNWRSADNNVARVSDRGVVTAAAAGTTQIIVTSGYATASATVSVEQAADSIELRPSSITLTQVGETGQFTAVVHDANDRIIPGAPVTWSSSHPEIATVDANGLVTAVSPGTSQITASSGGASTSRPVYVEVARAPARIVLNISEATLAAAGQSLQLDAQVYDSNGAAIPGAAVTWSSSRPEVATVDANGLVIAVSNGTTRITASSDGASAHALIHVVIEGTEPPEPPEPEPEPPMEPDPPEPPMEPEPPPETSSDRDVLVALYHATDGTNWTNNTNWLSEAPLGSWHGVTTDARGRITKIVLDFNNLRGPIPPELGQLANLVFLDLAGNYFTGGIPGDLGGLDALTVLNLTGNGLTGIIPAELGKLNALTKLGLYDNRLSGPIPPELGRLDALTLLSLHSNQLNGPIPPELGRLDALTELNLGGNQLTGIIPAELGQLDNLRDLYLSSNQLTGSIPTELGRLDALWDLRLADNQLTGIIPAELGQLDNLRDLYLSSNQLSGEIPAELGRLGKLNAFILAYNENLSGPLPNEITAISSLRLLNLEETRLCVPSNAVFRAWLDGIEEKSGVSFCEDAPEPSSDRDVLVALYHATDGPNWTNNTNWLSDKPLRDWYGVLGTDPDGRVTWIELSGNGLAGPLPPVLGKLDRLKSLYLHTNKLTGPIPKEIGNLRNLLYLYIGGNDLTGQIPPELGQLGQLSDLVISDSGLTGSIPPEIGKLRNLIILSFHRNQLNGQIPPEIGVLSNLQSLSLSYNSLSGPIPPEIANLTALERLSFNSNRLEGEIPPGIGNLRALVSLDFTNNRLTGEIPPGIGNLTTLKRLFLGENRLSGEIPPGIGNLTILDKLSLHINRLSGELPPELGNLVALTKLDVHGNQLSGGLPPELGDLSNLKSLDLRRNTGLTGPLPLSLTNIKLHDLWLGSTELCVPAEPVFQTWLDGITIRNGVTECSP